jgi:YqaJ-like viral recombinase domain
MSVEYLDVVQGSPEWFEARRGIPTSSMFQTILAGADGRTTYMRKLAGERITGEPASTYQNEDMLRGKRLEPEIRAYYELTKGVDVQNVGFIRCGKSGASTDGLIGDDGVVEFKSTEPHLLIAMLDRKPRIFPQKFYAQCQGGLMVSKRKWCDLVVYWPKMPKLVMRTLRDEAYIQQLRDAIDVFDLDLRRMVKRLKEF